MTNQTKYILIFVGILLIAGVVLYFGVLQTQFAAPPGWKSYGESGSIVTGANLVLNNAYVAQGVPHAYYERKWDSAYWTIETLDHQQDTSYIPVSLGDDFDVGHFDGNYHPTEYTKFTTKESFGKGRDFRFQVVPGSYDITGIGVRDCSGSNCLYELKSSPIVDDVQFYWNGQLVNTQSFAIPFNIGITSTSGHRILNPAFKDIYNCQVDPDEQYYFKIFGEGTTVSKAGLENFHKWCINEAPLQIWTNAGKTTDTLGIIHLESGGTIPVPMGAFYGVEYIGEKKTLITPCEQNELLVNGDTCTARTVLEFQFLCDGGILDVSTGQCIPTSEITNETQTEIIVQSSEVDYVVSSLQTHQFLANNSKIRFTHYTDDFSSSPSSFSLFGKTFISNGVTSQFGATPQTASFSYGTSIGDLAVGDIQVLDNVNKVALTRVELQDPIGVGIGDTQKFLAEWTFDIDTGFLVLSYDEVAKQIIVTNNYYPVSGGMSLIKTGQFTSTNDEITNLNFGLGETKVSIGDTTGLLSVAGRPYFRVETPDYNYKLSGSSAITISDLEEEQVIVTIADEPATSPIKLENIQGGDDAITSKPKIKISTGLIAGIVGGLVVLTSIFLIIRGLRRPRRKR